MICLRCGTCCVTYSVHIPKDPKLGLVKGNMEIKPSGVKCKYLEGDTFGRFSCSLRDYGWYKETLCYKFIIENIPGKRELTDIQKKNDPCPLGNFVVNGINSTILKYYKVNSNGDL